MELGTRGVGSRWRPRQSWQLRPVTRRNTVVPGAGVGAVQTELEAGTRSRELMSMESVCRSGSRELGPASWSRLLPPPPPILPLHDVCQRVREGWDGGKLVVWSFGRKALGGKRKGDGRRGPWETYPSVSSVPFFSRVEGRGRCRRAEMECRGRRGRVETECRGRRGCGRGRRGRAETECRGRRGCRRRRGRCERRSWGRLGRREGGGSRGVRSEAELEPRAARGGAGAGAAQEQEIQIRGVRSGGLSEAEPEPKRRPVRGGAGAGSERRSDRGGTARGEMEPERGRPKELEPERGRPRELELELLASRDARKKRRGRWKRGVANLLL